MTCRARVGPVPVLGMALLAVAPLVASNDLPASLSLDAAINLAVAHNLELARAGLGVERQRLAVEAAHAPFAVDVEPSGSFTTTDGETEWSYAMRVEKRLLTGLELGIEGEVAEYSSLVDEPWRSAARVELSQPLFRQAGALVQREPITQAEEGLKAEERAWERQKAGMIVSVVRSFESWVRLDRQLDGDAAVVDRLQRLHDLTEVRERQGRATRIDTLRAGLELGQARARMESHRESQFATWQQLAELLGIPDEPAMTLVPPLLPDIDLPEMKKAVTLALSNRLDLAQAIQDYRTAERQVGLRRRDLLPDLDLVASDEQSGAGSDFGESSDLDENTWSLGLRGGLNLINREGRTAVRGAQLDAEAARHTIRITARRIASEVQQAVSAYRQARTDFELAGRNYEVARARTELARTLFEMGRADSFSAAEAEIAYVDAEGTWLSARASASVAGYELLNAMGALTEVADGLKPDTGTAEVTW